MISTNRGETEISGPGFEVITDLQIIVHSVKRAFEQQGMPPEVVNQCIERAVANAIRRAGMALEEEHADICNSIAKVVAEIFKEIGGMKQ